MKFNKITSLCLAFAFAMSLSGAVSAQGSLDMKNMDGTQTLDNTSVYNIHRKNMHNASSNVTGYLPFFRDMNDREFASKINTSINDFYMKTMDEVSRNSEYAAKKPETRFNYELTGDSKYLSVIMQATINPGNTHAEHIKTLVLDRNQPKLYSLVDILGNGAYAMVDDSINKVIDANPGNYFKGMDGFKGTDSKTSFYINDKSELVVLYDKYEIAPGVAGVPVFVVGVPANLARVTVVTETTSVRPISSSTNTTTSTYTPVSASNTTTSTTALRPSETTTRPAVTPKQFTLARSHSYAKGVSRMVPLRMVGENLGYTVKWDKASRIAVISDSSMSLNLRPNVNSYDGKQLNYAPELRNGVVYVPVTFFDEILNVSYNVAQNGDVAFRK